MIPGYKSFLNRMALKTILKPVEVPNFHLGVYPYEVLENIENGRIAKTTPIFQDTAVMSGVDETTPNVGPYLGESLGGF